MGMRTRPAFARASCCLRAAARPGSYPTISASLMLAQMIIPHSAKLISSAASMDVLPWWHHF
jgi:hypothetical protein